VTAELLEAVGRLDYAAFQWLRSHHSPFLDLIMAGVSDIARGGALWLALAFLIGIIFRSRWPAVVQVVLAITMAYLVTDFAAKPFFDRSRPFESYAEARVYGIKPTTRSFPSGHAASAIAGAYALARLAPEAGVIFWIAAGLVMFSRVYLGVHYPGDVVSGALLGFAVAAFVVGGTTWRPHQDRFPGKPTHGDV
jgi:membrane-associated phospholipid phosphatase